MIKICPSVLAGDFANLESEIRKVENADMLHIDVMDGHFVPNITIGPPVVESLRKKTKMFFDTHLMISRPEDYIEKFAAAGADGITFHLESNDCASGQAAYALRVIKLIRSFNIKVGISIKPATPAEKLFPFLSEVDMVLLMAVEPGFGGQAFMADTLDKISAVRSYADTHRLDLDIQVDGGINPETAKLCVKAGADCLVAGTYIFHSPSPAETISALKNELISN